SSTATSSPPTSCSRKATHAEAQSNPEAKEGGKAGTDLGHSSVPSSSSSSRCASAPLREGFLVPKITDFGLAKKLDADEGRHSPGPSSAPQGGIPQGLRRAGRAARGEPGCRGAGGGGAGVRGRAGLGAGLRAGRRDGGPGTRGRQDRAAPVNPPGGAVPGRPAHGGGPGPPGECRPRRPGGG